MSKYVMEKAMTKLRSGDGCVQYVDRGHGFAGVFVKTHQSHCTL